MATPSLIPAFDDLGPDGFAHLCGALLSSRYPVGSVALGGIAADAGADARVDERFFRVLTSRVTDALGDDVLPSDQKVIFQFKHVVVGRAGEENARDRAIRYYRCIPSEKCELHKDGHVRLFSSYGPAAYRLITNVEVTQAFRESFVAQCTSPNHEPSPDINNYNVMGLDELEALLMTEPDLAGQILPGVYGPARFHLRVRVDTLCTYVDAVDGRRRWVRAAGIRLPDLRAGADGIEEFVQVTVQNHGASPSYIDRIEMRVVGHGHHSDATLIPDSGDSLLSSINSPLGQALPPGAAHRYNFRIGDLIQTMHAVDETGVPSAIRVVDQIGQDYLATIGDDVRDRLLHPSAYQIVRVSDDEYVNLARIFKYDYRQ